MFLTLLSAEFGYLDIAIIAVLALFLIIGLFRGVAKSLKGFLLTVSIILLSIFFVGLSYEPAKTFEPFVMMEDALTQSSENWGPSFNSPVVYDKTTEQFMLIIDGNPTDFSQADSPLKGNIAKFLANKFITEDGTTVASVAVTKLTNVLIMLILFVAFCIGLGIVFAIIRKLTEKLHFSSNAVVKTIDRIFGGLFSCAMMLLFICVVLAIISTIGEPAQVAIDYINSNIVGGFLLEKNPITMMFNNIFVVL